MPIKGLKPRFSILGHIKSGGRKLVKVRGQERRIPEKYDHFIITKSERDDVNFVIDDELMAKLVKYDKQPDGKLRHMVVFLPFDDIDENLLTTLAVYDGNGVRCRGDGESAEYIDPKTQETKKVQCPCRMLRIGLDGSRVEDRPNHDYLTPDIQRGQVCKTHGLLRVMIAEAKTMGGVHIYRTTSSNSIRQLLASMAHIQELTGGHLSYIPIELSIKPKRVKPEASQGYQTVFVVDLTYSAAPIEFLNDVAKQAQLRASMRQRIAAKEIAVLPAPGFEDPEEQRDIAEEYLATDALEDDGSVIDGDGEEVAPAKQEAAPKPKQEKRQETKPPAPKRGDKSEVEGVPCTFDGDKWVPDHYPPADDAPPPPTDNDAPPEAKTEEAPSSDDAKDPPSAPEDQLEMDQELSQEIAGKFPKVDRSKPEGADESFASKELRRSWIATAKKQGYTEAELRAWIKDLWDASSSAMLQAWQVTTMTEQLERKAATK